ATPPPDTSTLSLHDALPISAPEPAGIAVLSGATGAQPATAEERAWLMSMSALPVRATGSYLGHGLEPQFAMNIALATLALRQERSEEHTSELQSLAYLVCRL